MRSLSALLALMGAAAAAAATVPAPSPLATCVDDVLEFVRAADAAIAAAGNATPPTRNPPPLFHLHIPRTAGRTLHACLLTLAVKPSERCARAYGPGGGDKAARGPGCGLLASHDDASLLPLLPAGTDVVVQVRHPLARVLSAYEFATESAALAAAGLAGVAAAPPRKPGAPPRTPVAAVWPWSYLVPWARAEMEATGGKPCAAGAAAAGCAALASVPLPAFVDAPIVADLVHNGATLQVLGATNGSRAPGAARVRACVRGNAAAAAAAAAAAEARLRRWAAAGGAVGVSERLDDSVAAVAAARGWPLAGPAWPPPSHAGGDAPVTTNTLGAAFRHCEMRTRDRAGRRRAHAAGVLGGAPLGAGGRAAVPADLAARILAINAADVRLHAVAGELLDAALAGGKGGKLPPPPGAATPAALARGAATAAATKAEL